MAIGREMKRTFRGNKKTDNEWSNHSKSMRIAGGSPTTSAIKRVARSAAAVPTTSTSIARSGYAKKLRTQGMGSSARVNSRPLQQKSTRSIGMTEPTPRSAGSMSVGSSPRRANTASSAMSSRIKTAVDKRDYAIPESNIGRKTRNKMITRKYGR